MGLTVDGLDVQRPDMDIYLELVEGKDEQPEARTSSDVLPFRRGRLQRTSTADRRRLLLAGWIAGPAGSGAASGFRTYMDEIKMALDPERSTPVVLVDDFEDDTRRWIRAWPRNMVSAEGPGDGTRLLSVELDALDPFWYSAVGMLALDAGLLLDDGYVLDSGAEIVVSAAASFFDVLVSHPGSADTDAIAIRMSGASVGAVSVENVTAGVGFSAGVALAAGDDLRIDVRERTIERNGASVRSTTTLRAGNRNGEWLRLRPGTNRIRISGAPAETRILFNPAWQ